MAFQFERDIFAGPIPGDEIVFHILLAPAFDEFGGIGLERVDTGIGLWRLVVPREKLAGGVVAELLAPFFDEPFGVGPAEGGLGKFHVREDFADVIGLAEVAAKDGIDEPGLGTVAGAFGELDGLVDSGVWRDTVQPEDLVEAEAEQVLDGGALLAARHSLAGDETIKGGLPADDAADEFVAEAAIGPCEAGGGQGRFEQILSKITAG